MLAADRPAPARRELTSGPAVAARDLRVRRGGVEVLHGLDFQLVRGRVTGLLGPSGCGKTTLMRSLVGVQRHVTGELHVLGEPAGSPGLRHSVSYLTQAPSVYADLTVTENLRYFAALAGAPGASVASAVETVQLAAVADRPVRSLSGGQRTRVSLGTALLGDPELLVLDEPTVGLDPLLRQSLWALMRRLAAGGATLLVSSHVIDEARHCDELLLMREGRILAQETPAALAQQGGSPDLDEAFARVIERGDGERGDRAPEAAR